MRLIKVAAAAGMHIALSSATLLVEDVVLAVLHRLGRQDALKLVAAGVLLSPLADRLEHVTLNLNALVANGGVVERTKDVVYDLVDGDVGVVPSKQNSAAGWLVRVGYDSRLGYLRNSVLKNSRSNTASARVEHVGKVILGQHRVGWVRAAGVLPRLKLRLGTGSNDARRAILEDHGDLIDDGTDEWGKEAQNKRRKCLADMLKELLESRNLGNATANCLDNLVAELQDGVNLAGRLDRVKVGAHSGNEILVILRASALLLCAVLLFLSLGHGLELTSLRGKAVSVTRQLGNQRNKVSRTIGTKEASISCAAVEASRSATTALGVLQRDVDLVNFGLGEVVGCLANDGVKEINRSKGSRDDGINRLAAKANLSLGAAVREHVVVAKFAERKLTVVAMGTKVLHAVQSLSKASESLAQVFVFALAAGTVRVETAKVHAASQTVAKVSGAGSPVSGLVGNVVLHSSVHIDFGLDRLNRASQTRVKLSCVGAIGISEGVVDVLFGAVDTETLLGDFELFRCVSEGHERQDPDLEDNC